MKRAVAIPTRLKDIPEDEWTEEDKGKFGIIDMTPVEIAEREADEIANDAAAMLNVWAVEMQKTDRTVTRGLEDVIDWGVSQGWDLSQLNKATKDNYEAKKQKRAQRPA